MRYAIYCNSVTGNTKLLAEQIPAGFDGECLYSGDLYDQKMNNAEIVFIGFWTDKGRCNEVVSDVLKQIKHKKIFLFGTAGFGGAADYFERILENVKRQVDPSCQIVGTYMCQGKMPMSVRERYQKMVDSDPLNEQFKGMVANFDKALSHPDTNDLEQFKKAIGKIQ